MNMRHRLMMGQVWSAEHPRNRKNMPSSAWHWVHCRPRSITFPKKGWSNARLHTFPSGSFTLPLLNYLLLCRQNGYTGSPAFKGLMHNLQSDAPDKFTGFKYREGLWTPDSLMAKSVLKAAIPLLIISLLCHSKLYNSFICWFWRSINSNFLPTQRLCFLCP